MNKLKAFFSKEKLVGVIAFLAGWASNTILIFFVYWLGITCKANHYMAIIVSAAVAYPLATIARKYTAQGLTKIWIKK